MSNEVTIEKEQLIALWDVYLAVKSLPFGESPALPWCLESFPELENALRNIEANLEPQYLGSQPNLTLKELI